MLNILWSDGWIDIEAFGKAKQVFLRKYLDYENGIPSDDTLSRFFRALDPEQFQEKFISWAKQLTICMGVTLTQSNGNLKASPVTAITDEVRELIRENKTAWLELFERKTLFEARRQQLIAKLNARPDIRYAITVDNPDTDPVAVAVGIRNVATCELVIPVADYDAFKLLQLIRNWEGG